MSGFSLNPVLLRRTLLALALAACAFPIAGQITTSGEYKFLNANGRSRNGTDASFKIFVYFMDRNGSNLQEFYVPSALDFDFAGAEASGKKIRIEFAFPNNKGLKVVLRRSCISLPESMTLHGPASLGRTQDPPYSTEGFIELVARQNGPFNIDIDYDVLHEDLDPMTYPCEQRNTLTLSGVVRGIKPPVVNNDPPPPPPIDCRREIARARTDKDCARLIELTLKGCSDAAIAFETLKKDFIDRCKDEDKQACEDYLSCDVNGDFDSQARRMIAKIESRETRTPEQEDPASKAWRAVEKSRDYDQFRNFYNSYPNSDYARKALDSLKKYFDWSIVLVDRPDNRRIYQIDSFGLVKNIRWKDVSVGGSLQVDMNSLSSDGKITVEFVEQGDYLIYFEDAYGQRDSISFSTQLKGKLKKGTKDYTVLFESGTKPYTVELVDPNTNTPVKTFKDVSADSLLISMEEVAALDRDQLKVWVKDKTGLKASVDGDILSSSPLDFKKVAAFAAIILLGLLVIYLLISFVRRKRMNVQLQ